MGTSTSSNRNNQVLANDSSNQNQLLLNNQILPSRINESDISLQINDQPQIKKIFAIKNPVYLKRNSLCLERDSSNRNLFYITFKYDAIVDMDINIYFNATRNLKKLNHQEKNSRNAKEISKSIRSVNINSKSDINKNEYSGININRTENHQPNSGNSLQSFTVSSGNYFELNYIPSQNFLDKIIAFKSCPRGHNINFTDKNLFIDMDEYISKKINSIGCSSDDACDYYDIVIEFVPILKDNQNLIKDNEKDSEIIFYTLCRLNHDDPNYKIKTDMQRLKSQGMWFDIHEVFNSALESGECLICCSNVRNTLFLPCKHSCTCQTCAHSLRMRNNPCPICKNSKRNTNFKLKIKNLIFYFS